MAERSTAKRSNAIPLLLPALVCGSGMGAVVLQLTWQRELQLIFGASAPAAAAVLAVFIGGLGLGSILLGRAADRKPHPLRWYGQLEIGVALTAALTPFLVEQVRTLYLSLGGQTALGAVGATLVRLALTTVVLGAPTVLLGGTLPAAAQALTHGPDVPRRRFAWLYGLNTLGGVGGAVPATFVLLEALGTRQTLWLACGVNGFAGSFALLLARWTPGGAALESHALPPSASSPLRGAAATPTAGVDQRAGLVYVAAGVVGFVFFLLELIWNRMLTPLLGGTTYTFGIILALVLLGIGLGGLFYPLLFRRRLPTLRWLAVSCGLEALAVALPYAAGDRVAYWSLWLRPTTPLSLGELAIGWVIVAGFVIVPAAVVAGVQFPLLISLLGQGERSLGRHVGMATGVNTLGAMAGAVAGGFGLLPLLSAPGAWRFAVTVLSGVALVILWFSRKGARCAGLPASAGNSALDRIGDDAHRRRTPAVLASVRQGDPRHDFRAVALRMMPAMLALGAVVLVMVSAGPTAVWRHSGIGAGRSDWPLGAEPNARRDWEQRQRRVVQWEADGVESGVALVATHGLSFLLNGKSDGNALRDAPTQIMLGMIGAILHPLPKTGLVIGLGTGETAGWLAEVGSMERVDVVELEPAIDEVAERCCAVNHDVLHHPKVRRIVADGRELLLTTAERYDLIASEPSNPYRAGVASLYTREFYAAVQRRLNPDGLFLQWLQGYEIDSFTLNTVLATLRSEFRHVEIWQTRARDLVLVCSAAEIGYRAAALRARIAEPAVQAALRTAWNVTDLEGFCAHYVAGRAAVEHLGRQAGTAVNTDDRNVLEYSFARSLGRHEKFSVASLRSVAVQTGADQAPTEARQLDRARVAEERLFAQALAGEPLSLPKQLTLPQKLRVMALRDYLQGNPAAARSAWLVQPRAPATPIELLLLAHGCALAGDRRAVPLLDRLRPIQPVSTAVLSALLLEQEGRRAAAAAALRDAFQQLQTDPWTTEQVMAAAFRMAETWAETSGATAAQLYEGLRQPWAAGAFEEERQQAALAVARCVGTDQVIEALAVFEPNVPWKQEFLQARFDAYHQAGHPLAARAARDLDAFRRQAADKATN